MEIQMYFVFFLYMVQVYYCVRLAVIINFDKTILRAAPLELVSSFCSKVFP